MAVASPSCRRRVGILGLCAVLLLTAGLLLAAPAQSAGDDERLTGLRFAPSLERPADVPVPRPASAEAVAESPSLYDRLDGALSQAAESAGAVLRPVLDKAVETARGVTLPSLDGGVTHALDLATRVRRGVIEPIWETYLTGPGEGGAEDDPAPPAILAVAPTMRDALRVQYDAAIQAALTADDPLEEFNRVMFGLNDRLRHNLLYPVTSFYLRVTSPQFQQGVRNFFANLRMPVTIASDLLEGQFGEAGIATLRFGINSTIGVVGVLDPAARMGFRATPRELEEALCVYGVGSGPYLVLPLFGPGTFRDAAGRVMTVVAYNAAMGPAIYVPYRLSDIAVRSIDVQKQLDRLNATSIDPYVAQRVLVLSARALDCGRQAEVSSEYFHK
jgi:phospholipid-binding lipoprotein MlaA